MTVLLIRDAEIDGTAGLDLRVCDGRIERIGRALSTDTADDVIDARGGALLPGLHDHHLHLHAAAADAASVRCGPPAVRGRAELAAALAAAPGDEHGWVRGVGYIDTVAGDLDAAALDAVHDRRPVRVQHRSGALWVLNTAALTAAGLATATHPGVERATDGTPTGRIWRADNWLRERLPGTAAPRLATLGATLAAYGITGVTDATPDLSPTSLSALTSAHTDGDLPQHLHLLGVPLDARTDFPDRIGVGPYKIVLADSGLLAFDDLVDRIRLAHDAGRAVAVHCVSREALLLLLAALDVAGDRPGDRVEHGALIPADVIADLHRHGLRVVTQPGFLADRGDYYRAHVDTDDLPDLYRCRTLVEANVPLALSSDAPYGPLDPWTVLVAATTRTTESGAPLNPAERLTPAQALAGYLTPPDDPGGAPIHLRPGARADLVLLHAPLGEALRAPSADFVHTTVIHGRSITR
ncbi:amidohydrolase family protein [Nocardia bovistercoris]|uniref:Amidohydrolase family protein n=1 Tax=Nocardia bovistercoris TaxID=2785916 RepID=A0A931N169_9NOCA|nr:amidohydrolase family protein [Nocardia bovistercoris]MBH0778055.1 amidohydrolase family protein [Nocardia bovistercoris]